MPRISFLESARASSEVGLSDPLHQQFSDGENAACVHSQIPIAYGWQSNRKPIVSTPTISKCIRQRHSVVPLVRTAAPGCSLLRGLVSGGPCHYHPDVRGAISSIPTAL